MIISAINKKITKRIIVPFVAVMLTSLCVAALTTSNYISDLITSKRFQSDNATVVNMSFINESHRLLISGSNHERIAVVDYDGSTVWELQRSDLWIEVNDADMAANGNIVYAARTASGSFVRMISPDYINGGYNLIWEYAVPSGGENHTCQLLEDGNTLICEAYTDHIRILELDGYGKTVKTIGENLTGFSDNIGSHNQIRQVTKTEDGTYLLTHFTNDITYEINESGDILKQYPFGKGFTAVKDKDKNVIISGGNQSAVKAYKPDGTELWTLEQDSVDGITLGFPAAIIPLDNGNILLANWGGHGGASGASAVVEIDPVNKELVWYMNTKDSGNISNIFLLDGYSQQLYTADSDYRSPIDVVSNASRNVVYTADYTNKKIIVLSALSDTPIATYAMPDTPNSLLLANDGNVLYVACGEKNGIVVILDTQTGTITETISVGYTPSSLALDDEENNLYVANRFDSSVTKITLADNKLSGEVVSECEITREPIALSYSNGKLFVGSHLPNVPATADCVSSEVCIVNPENLNVEKRLLLTDGSTDLKDMTLSPDKRYLYVSHTIGRYWVPTTQVDRGWVYTNAVTEIDTQSQEITASMLIDDMDEGAGNPWGIFADDNNLVVTTSGTSEVIIIDRNEMRNRIQSVADGIFVGDGSVTNVSDIQNSLTFLSGIKNRVKLNCSGTKGVTVLNEKIYAANYYSGSVSVVSLTSAKKIKDIQFFTDVADDDKRIGERLWNDATLCFGNWQSCASCHPDARTDGLNWDNMNDGIGTPKQARTMVDTFKRGRVMATGIRANASVAVKAGMKYIMFNNSITDMQYEQIEAYLQSLQPEESPYRNDDGTLSESASRGKALFEGKAECISCHSGVLKGQDKFVYNTDLTKDDERGFLIPPLREVWRTAPYMHDGSALTIDEVLTKKMNAGFSAVSALTAEERKDLAEYVLSLDGNEDAVLKGDIDCNGVIDIRDLVRFKKNFASGKHSDTSDLNGDGIIDTADMILLKKYLLGVIVSF